MKRLTYYIQYLFLILAAIMTGALTILMAYERNTMDFETYHEFYTAARRCVPLSFALSIGFLLASGLLIMVLRPFAARITNRIPWQIIPVAAALMVAVEGMVWNHYYPYAPVADQWKAWSAALRVAQGHPFELDDPVYFQANPQQKCMSVAMSWIVQLLGGDDTARTFIAVNIVASAIIAASLCILCHQSFHRRSITAITAVLIAVFCPHAMYSSFVYGTQIALMCVLLAYICCIHYFHTEHVRWLLPAWILMPIAFLFYMSSIIAEIAMVIMILLHLLRRNGRQIIATGLLVLCIPLLSLTARHMAIQYFDNLTGLEDMDGMPTATWIVMGITAENGAYTPEYYDLYCDEGPDAARAALQERLSGALRDYRDGTRSLAFFVQKTLYQWCDPWFNAGIMTVYLWNPIDPQPSQSYFDFMQGRPMQTVERWLSLYVSTSYLATLLALCAWIRRRRTPPDYILPILYFIGGFLFQFLWEAKGRYCYPYYLMLIPLFAYELVMIADKMQNLTKRGETGKTHVSYSDKG